MYLYILITINYWHHHDTSIIPKQFTYKCILLTCKRLFSFLCCVMALANLLKFKCGLFLTGTFSGLISLPSSFSLKDPYVGSRKGLTSVWRRFFDIGLCLPWLIWSESSSTSMFNSTQFKNLRSRALNRQLAFTPRYWNMSHWSRAKRIESLCDFSASFYCYVWFHSNWEPVQLFY